MVHSTWIQTIDHSTLSTGMMAHIKGGDLIESMTSTMQ